MDMQRIEEMIKTMTAQQVADRLDISADSLRYHLKINGVDVNEIKREYAIQTLRELSHKHTLKEIIKITGFSRRKIQNLSAKGYVVLKLATKNTALRGC